MEARIRAALLLYAFLIVGLFLLAAPWTAVWNRAVVGLLPTGLGSVARSGWLRGLVSGLGVINVLIAVQVAAELWGTLRRPSPRGGPPTTPS